MSMFWLPRIQNVFNVVPALACNGITQPYWETNFIYPISNPQNPPATYTATATATKATATKATTTKSTTTKAKRTTTKTETKTSIAPSTPSNTNCLPGSFGNGYGNGYGGYCCSKKQDCLNDCLMGVCTGPTNPLRSTTPVNTIISSTPTIAKPNPTTRTTTIKATTSARVCIPGSSNKKLGDGKTGYCCTTSDDCLAVCRGTICGA